MELAMMIIYIFCKNITVVNHVSCSSFVLIIIIKPTLMIYVHTWVSILTFLLRVSGTRGDVLDER
jgi:hypothetical protein